MCYNIMRGDFNKNLKTRFYLLNIHNKSRTIIPEWPWFSAMSFSVAKNSCKEKMVITASWSNYLFIRRKFISLLTSPAETEACKIMILGCYKIYEVLHCTIISLWIHKITYLNLFLTHVSEICLREISFFEVQY